jgi:hypothetical protein
VRMNRCALVSVNGGWNLLIGAQTASGAWAPVDVPPACMTVWDEAEKDACFERAARAEIAAAPVAWAGRAGAKLAATFDYFGAAPWYLHASNPVALDDRAKTALGAFETLVSRVLLLCAMLAVARFEGPRPRARRALLAVGAVAAFTVHGWVGYVALGAAPSRAPRSSSRGPPRSSSRPPPSTPSSSAPVATGSSWRRSSPPSRSCARSRARRSRRRHARGL